ncbi:LysR family transcriptional regulator [Williamsia deligens]|uniref:LysR family transcriptional regulator n=1 Tax=Williamsia deligens TaxID=321325 RepID=A0ABW3GEE9_9NOCA|nr:LysR family transcriptional regulator [Williamsia deligens]MCP2196234.1 transcriptional regulator, LysR family [Williamsia deligens]
MELHQLRYVVAVVDEGSFTAAAESVRVSQSGVSAQIAKLERELGVALLDRTTRRVRPTAAGEHLIPVIRAAVAAVDSVRDTASAIRGVVAGRLRVGTVGGLGWPPVFDALAALHAAHPGLDISVIEDAAAPLVDRVRAGEIDVAVAAWTGDGPDGLRFVTVVDDGLAAWVTPDHPWATRDAVGPDDLADADVISQPEGTGARAALDAVLAGAAGRRPRWEVATPATALALAARGLGVAVLSQTTGRGAGGVVDIRIDDPRARSSLGIVWRDDPAPATRALLDRLLPAADGT